MAEDVGQSSQARFTEKQRLYATARNYLVDKDSQDDFVADVIELIAECEQAAQDGTARFYKNEMEHWKRTAESFIERDGLKIEPKVICASCGTKLNQSQDKETK